MDKNQNNNNLSKAILTQNPKEIDLYLKTVEIKDFLIDLDFIIKDSIKTGLELGQTFKNN